MVVFRDVHMSLPCPGMPTYPPTRPCDHSDLTEATLAGASISLVATGAILLLIVLVRPHGACSACLALPHKHGCMRHRILVAVLHRNTRTHPLA